METWECCHTPHFTFSVHLLHPLLSFALHLSSMASKDSFASKTVYKGGYVRLMYSPFSKEHIIVDESELVEGKRVLLPAHPSPSEIDEFKSELESVRRHYRKVMAESSAQRAEVIRFVHRTLQQSFGGGLSLGEDELLLKTYREAFQLTKKLIGNVIQRELERRLFPCVVCSKQMFCTPDPPGSGRCMRAYFDTALCVSKEDHRPIMTILVRPPYAHSRLVSSLNTTKGLRRCQDETTFHVTCARQGAGIPHKEGITLYGFCTDGKRWIRCETRFHARDSHPASNSTFQDVPPESLYETMRKAWDHNVRVANTYKGKCSATIVTRYSTVQ